MVVYFIIQLDLLWGSQCSSEHLECKSSDVAGDNHMQKAWALIFMMQCVLFVANIEVTIQINSGHEVKHHGHLGR